MKTLKKLMTKSDRSTRSPSPSPSPTAWRSQTPLTASALSRPDMRRQVRARRQFLLFSEYRAFTSAFASEGWVAAHVPHVHSFSGSRASC